MLIGEFNREQEGESLIIFNSWITDSKRMGLSVNSLVERSNGRERYGKYNMLCAIHSGVSPESLEALTPK